MLIDYCLGGIFSDTPTVAGDTGENSESKTSAEDSPRKKFTRKTSQSAHDLHVQTTTSPQNRIGGRGKNLTIGSWMNSTIGAGTGKTQRADKAR